MAVPFQTHGYSFMSCKLKMDTNHPKWQKTLRKILDCIKVYRFNMDENGTVLVSGRTSPYVFLNEIGKAGKRAELVLLKSGECSGCLNMPPSSANPPPPPPPVLTRDDFKEDDRQYANVYNNYLPRLYDPYYSAYGGGSYGGWGGYNDRRPHSYHPFGEWDDLLIIDPHLNTWRW